MRCISHADQAQRAGRHLAIDRRARQQRHAQAALYHLFRGLDVVELHHAAGLHAGGQESRLRDLVVAGSAVEHDHLLTADIAHLHVRPARKGVAGSHHQHQLLLVEGDQLDVGMLERAADPQLHLVAQDQLLDLLGVAGAHRDLDTGVPRYEALQHRRQQVGAGRGGHRQQELAGQPAAHLVDRPPAVAQRAHRPLREGQEGATLVRQAHAVAGAHEQLVPHVPLQRLQARGQRGLGDVQNVRRAADTAQPGHLQEALDVNEQH